MTINHSSSPPVTAAAPNLVDAGGRVISLGPQLGKGGEGTVYEVHERSAAVAKIYHQPTLDPATVAKLTALVTLRSPELSAIAAWPESILYRQAGGQPCGILLPKIAAARQLHELYGSANRRLHFPKVHWHHLLLAAKNLAMAFDTLHAAGIVVGDVNQGNLLVDHQMRVHFIDCDSFQITHDGQTFPCPVGTPHFTPPELQSQQLREVARSTEHDNFGLAVLIFHLLFMGRHPFAGRFRGEGDLPLERAIAEGRFAFSRHREATLVDPPPASLSLEELPPDLGNLFEQAFRGSGGERGSSPRGPRPTPAAWAAGLAALLRRRQVCSVEAQHVFYNQLSQCPWCRIENEGGPAFFAVNGGVSAVSRERLGEFDRRIALLQIPTFPSLGPRRLDLPGGLALRAPKIAPRLAKLDVAAGALLLGAVAGVAGLIYPPVLVAGTLAAVGGGAYLLRSPTAIQRRQRQAGWEKKLGTYQQRLLSMGRLIRRGHGKRSETYQQLVRELKTALRWYRAEGAELQQILRENRGTQLTEYLRRQLLSDHVAEIPGLTDSTLAMLESFNVETALQIDPLLLTGIPNISSGDVMELLQWRAQVEQEFKSLPENQLRGAQRPGRVADGLGTRGQLPPDRSGGAQLTQAEAADAQRFKVAQARKVLMGCQQLEALVQGGRAELNYALRQFDKLGDKAKGVARKLRDFLSGRRKTERLLNRSPLTICLLAFGLPLVCWLVQLMLRW